MATLRPMSWSLTRTTSPHAALAEDLRRLIPAAWLERGVTRGPSVAMRSRPVVRVAVTGGVKVRASLDGAAIVAPSAVVSRALESSWVASSFIGPLRCQGARQLSALRGRIVHESMPGRAVAFRVRSLRRRGVRLARPAAPLRLFRWPTHAVSGALLNVIGMLRVEPVEPGDSNVAF